MEQKTILVADDERRIRDLLSEFLIDEGFNVIAVENGQMALKEFNTNVVDLLILDVMMPELDGWRVLSEIRKNSSVPVIMLTAKTEECDELNSFERGASDFISKPFSLSVLLARINAQLKTNVAAAGREKLVRGEIYINQDTHEVKVNNTVIALTPIEYRLILLFCQNQGHVFSREQLLKDVWKYENDSSNRTVDTHMGRLREKLGACGKKYIKTVRNYGYRFDSTN